jgi:hypothetical protein
VKRDLGRAMSILQGITDVSKQFCFDQIESGLDITIKLAEAITDTLLHKILEEGGHLGDVATANRVQEVVDPCVQRHVHLQRQQSRRVVLSLGKCWEKMMDLHVDNRKQ